jgi:putative transposase
MNILKDISDWKFSSYHSIISDEKTFLEKNQVIDWYGGQDEFLLFHNKEVDSSILIEYE